MNAPVIIAGVALMALAAVFAVALFARAGRRVGRQCVAFAVIGCAFLYAAATKPSVTWDDGIANDGTHYTNNYATVRFKWKKTNAAIPNATAIHFARKATGETAWTAVGESTVGALTYDLSIENTNAVYYVYTEYVPVPPVHTNGVWLGQIIEKARGAGGVNKIVIINGKIIDHGVIIAPKREE